MTDSFSWSLPVAAGLLGAFLANAPALGQEFQPWDELPARSDYVVHEWGTFTCMVGRHGLALEGLHREEEALPGFVHDLLKVDELERTRSKLPASRVTQKMETPVIYFYTDRPMRAQVDVWFLHGLMTQFYPLPDLVQPTLPELRAQRLDMSKVDVSSLTWQIELIPHADQPPAGIPEVAPTDPWAFARQTSSAYLRTLPSAGGERQIEAEHYLFYRGLGRWNPEVQLAAGRRGVAHFRNSTGKQIPFTMVLEIGDQGCRFQRGPALENGAGFAFDLSAETVEPDRERFARRVGAEVQQGLTAEGLYVDEARAMVATWSRSWFQSTGSRVIYFLPRQSVDEVLPLVLRPQPRELVRVLVGRHEFITPEVQDRVEGALEMRAAADPDRRQAGEDVLLGLDRFLEPHLRNVVLQGRSASVRQQAAAMLAAMVTNGQ